MWKSSLKLWKEFWQKEKNLYNLQDEIYWFSEVVKKNNSQKMWKSSLKLWKEC